MTKMRNGTTFKYTKTAAFVKLEKNTLFNGTLLRNLVKANYSGTCPKKDPLKKKGPLSKAFNENL